MKYYYKFSLLLLFIKGFLWPKQLPKLFISTLIM